MANWLIFLIIYFGYTYIFSVLYLGIKEEMIFNGIRETVLSLLLLIPISVIMMVLMPAVGIHWCMLAINREKIETFTIHELTEENRIALRQLGFEEGKFINRSNIAYEGFRKRFFKGRAIISVCNDGRVSIWGERGEEVKVIINQIRLLPEGEPKVEDTIESKEE